MAPNSLPLLTSRLSEASRENGVGGMDWCRLLTSRLSEASRENGVGGMDWCRLLTSRLSEASRENGVGGMDWCRVAPSRRKVRSFTALLTPIVLISMVLVACGGGATQN